MPIKFRCPHCEQLLGISRSKANAVVDCPTCGRQLRVPGPDKQLAPIPDPQLDLGDAQLAEALRELAAIPEGSDEGLADTPAPEARRQPVQVMAVPLPEAPAPKAKLVSPRRSSRETSAQAETNEGEDPLVSLTEAADWDDVNDVDPPWYRHPAARAALVLLAAGLFFGLGYYVRDLREMAVAEAASRKEEESRQRAVARKAAAGIRDLLPAIAGRISYVTENGNLRSDRGARLIALPQQRKGDVRLSIVGFRSGDSEADVAVARAALRALGGDMAVADTEGQFQVLLPEAGNYHVVVLSRFQPVPPEKVAPPELMRILARDFDRPEQLLGHTQYHWADLPFRGEETRDWDYVFAHPSERRTEEEPGSIPILPAGERE